MSRESPVQGILRRVREMVDPAIADVLAGLGDELGEPARYHFEGRGKGIRPALAILSAEAVGAPAETGVPGAVAIELIHDFSLIHDDIIDGDTERRHRATVWAKFGNGVGVLVGDALHALAFEVLLADPTPERVRASKALTGAVSAMITGQSLDMATEQRSCTTLEQCLAMERGKTGALLAYASSVGAVLAGADDTVVEGLAGYGMNLGVAFQAVDDLLGIWGDPERTGKPSGSDLRERKRSVPVVIALNSGTPAAADLAALYARPHLDAGDVDAARALVESGGGREGTEALARTHHNLAVGAIDLLEDRGVVVAGAAEELRLVADFIMGRDF
ncbi:polyprenyl synthetase family protein [Candidatus Poriferisocius sp.]|uniref:polyprenyl synthetase family protein n=1 Tax=Candidatus Poriferisocius sp. TaxID=3101276 RepID=UPI003B01E439